MYINYICHLQLGFILLHNIGFLLPFLKSHKLKKLCSYCKYYQIRALNEIHILSNG